MVQDGQVMGWWEKVEEQWKEDGVAGKVEVYRSEEDQTQEVQDIVETEAGLWTYSARDGGGSRYPLQICSHVQASLGENRLD